MKKYEIHFEVEAESMEHIKKLLKEIEEDTGMKPVPVFVPYDDCTIIKDSDNNNWNYSE